MFGCLNKILFLFCHKVCDHCSDWMEPLEIAVAHSLLMCFCPSIHLQQIKSSLNIQTDYVCNDFLSPCVCVAPTFPSFVSLSHVITVSIKRKWPLVRCVHNAVRCAVNVCSIIIKAYIDCNVIPLYMYHVLFHVLPSFFC